MLLLSSFYPMIVIVVLLICKMKKLNFTEPVRFSLGKSKWINKYKKLIILNEAMINISSKCR